MEALGRLMMAAGFMAILVMGSAGPDADLKVIIVGAMCGIISMIIGNMLCIRQQHKQERRRRWHTTGRT